MWRGVAERNWVGCPRRGHRRIRCRGRRFGGDWVPPRVIPLASLPLALVRDRLTGAISPMKAWPAIGGQWGVTDLTGEFSPR